MTENVLIASSVLLWIIVLFLLVVVLLIYKQVGELIIERGGAPRHDDQGPPTGEAAPLLRALDLDTGGVVERRPRSEVLVFAFPGCPGCEQIAETLPVLARHRREVGVTLLSVFSERDLEQAGGHVPGLAQVIFPDSMHVPEGRAGFSILVAPASDEDGPHRRYGVSATPFAILVDADGNVATKAMLRSPEHLPRMVAPEDEDELLVEPAMVEVGGQDGSEGRS